MHSDAAQLGGTSASRQGGAEFRTIRRVLYGIYLAFVIGFCGLVTVSILVTLYGRQPRRAGERARPGAVPALPGDPRHLEACERELSSLQRELVGEFVDVQRRLRGSDVERAWRTYSSNWKRRWLEAGQRCQLGEAAAASHPAFRTLARVHAELESTRMGYNALIGRLANEQAPRLRRIQQGLDEVRRAQAASKP